MSGSVTFESTTIGGSAASGERNAAQIKIIKNELSSKLQNLFNRYKTRVNAWRPKLRSFATAFHNASENVNTTLKSHGDRMKARHDVLFAILGSICGPSLSWVGNSLKASTVYTKHIAENAVREAITGKLADAVKWSVGKGVDTIKEASAIEIPKFSRNPKEFQTELMNNFDRQIGRVEKLLVGVDSEILFGDALASQVYFEFAQKSQVRASAWIDRWIHELEAAWCQNIIYYARTPNLPPQAQMERMIERAMWAKWLKDAIALKRLVTQPGEYGVKFYTADDIESRLVELNVMKPSGRADQKRVAAMKKTLAKSNVNWETTKPTLANPGLWTSREDMIAIARWAQTYVPEQIGNLGTPASQSRRPG